MVANLYQANKDSLDYKNTTSDVIPHNTIVDLGTRICVVGKDIQPGDVGTLYCEGVFRLPKASGEIALGSTLYYDSTNDNITTAASHGSSSDKVNHTPAGWAIAAATASDTIVAVKLLG